MSACGGDDEPESRTTRTLPELTQPAGEPTETAETAPEIETVEPAPEPTPTEDSGGTPAPTPEPPADSPDNDVPPPTDSPAERFEEFCDDNPGACG